MPVPNKVKCEMQEVYHQINVLLDLLNEKPTKYSLKSIKAAAIKIKGITEKYVN